MELENKIYIGQLIDVYGSLLTDNQLSVMKNYYMQDISISEIADDRKTTRQSIFDCIQRTTKILENFEKEFEWLQKQEYIQQNLTTLLEMVQDDEAKTIIKNILYKL